MNLREDKVFIVAVLFFVCLSILGVIRVMDVLDTVRRHAKRVRQKAQFGGIQAAIELFKNETGNYPPSAALDITGEHYCGAMKVTEAVLGQDLKGFQKESAFRSDGMNESGTGHLYKKEYVRHDSDVRMRPLVHIENANAHRLNEIYEDAGPFDGNSYVLCDTYLRKRHSGKKVGMTILYYKADTSNHLHDPNRKPTPTDNKGNIYNYWDNHALVSLGIPGKNSTHSLADPVRFYRNIENTEVITGHRPYRRDAFILISAGNDGEYGTADDICNYEWKYRED
jgi:hypothetical protein